MPVRYVLPSPTWSVRWRWALDSNRTIHVSSGTCTWSTKVSSCSACWGRWVYFCRDVTLRTSETYRKKSRTTIVKSPDTFKTSSKNTRARSIRIPFETWSTLICWRSNAPRKPARWTNCFRAWTRTGRSNRFSATCSRPAWRPLRIRFYGPWCTCSIIRMWWPRCKTRSIR